MGGTDLEEQLTAWLGGTVSSLRRLSGGASRETWSLVLDRGSGDERVILQRERARASTGSGGGMVNEAELLPAAEKAGVPVAPVVAADPAGEHLGAPAMVLGFVDGETIARRILRDDEYAKARVALTGDCARALASIHSIDTALVPGLTYTDQLQQYRDVWDQFDQASPAFELAFRWLDANRPDTTGRAVVHGDFRLGNLIVDSSGLRAVVDWELGHLGDPMEDLGWLCTRAWRFGSPKPVAGVGEYDELIAAYEEASGVPVDREVLRWWETLGTLKWGIMCMMQAQSHLLGFSRSVELAAIGRRVCENEHDVLLLLP